MVDTLKAHQMLHGVAFIIMSVCVCMCGRVIQMGGSGKLLYVDVFVKRRFV